MSEDPEVAVRQIEGFRRLEDDWDGYGGRPATSAAVADAMEFLERLSPSAPVPTATMSGEGEISLIWKTTESYADVGFRGDGTYSFYAETPDARELLGDDIPVDHLDQRLASLIDPVRRGN